MYARLVRVRCALLGVGGLSIASCNAIFGISDPEPNAGVGGGGSSNAGGSSGSEVGGSGGSNSSNGGTEDAMGGSGDPGGAGGGDDAGAVDTVQLSGVVQLFHTRAPSAGVELTAFVGASQRFNATSGENGEYSLSGIPAGSTVNLELAYPDTADPARPAALLQTRLRFDVGSSPEQLLDLSHIDYDWLARTADDCGAYQERVTVNPEQFFTQSASVIVQVTDGGQGVAGVSIEALQITLTNGGASDVNKHQQMRLPDTNPAFVCALEDSDSGLYPSQAAMTNELGLLVMFRVRNDPQGTGSGEAVVTRADSAASASVSLRQSGQSGVVVLGD